MQSSELNGNTQLKRSVSLGTALINMIHNADIGFLIVELNLETKEIIHISESATSILGVTPQQVEGREYTEFIANEKTETIDRLNKALDDKGSDPIIGFFNTLYHSNGTTIPVRWYADGTKTHYSVLIGIVQDFTFCDTDLCPLKKKYL